MGAYVIKLRECSWMSVPILLHSLTGNNEISMLYGET